MTQVSRSAAQPLWGAHSANRGAGQVGGNHGAVMHVYYCDQDCVPRSIFLQPRPGLPALPIDRAAARSGAGKLGGRLVIKELHAYTAPSTTRPPINPLKSLDPMAAVFHRVTLGAITIMVRKEADLTQVYVKGSPINMTIKANIEPRAAARAWLSAAMEVWSDITEVENIVDSWVPPENRVAPPPATPTPSPTAPSRHPHPTNEQPRSAASTTNS